MQNDEHGKKELPEFLKSKDHKKDGPETNDAKAQFIVEKVKECSSKLQAAQKEISKEIWGQDAVIELTIACMVAGGHLLFVGVPGLAKTRLVSRISKVMGLDYNRVQFTPDLMPADIIGSEILKDDENGRQVFEFLKGPLFTQFLMADEINRASPRTQAALLEAMQERSVTVGDETYTLQKPFTVMATQNPLEQEGTYPLPEAQLDRFLMKINVDYPDEAAERKVMDVTTKTNEDIQALFAKSAAGEDLTWEPDQDNESKLERVLDLNDLILIQKLARSLPLPVDVQNAAVQIVRRARPGTDGAPEEVNQYVSCGPGPRAVQAFAQVAKARALMRGDLAPTIDDLKAVLRPVLEHRMALNYQAKADHVSFDKIANALTLGL